MAKTVDKSCWTCQWQNIGGHETLLGDCTYPSKNNPERKKSIPPDFVDAGCKFWEKRVERSKQNMEVCYV